MRLAFLCLFMLRLAVSGQVIFAAGGDAQTLGCLAPGRPDLVLAVPGEYIGGTGFPGRMRTRVFAYDALQSKPAIPAEPATFSSSYPWRIDISTTIFWVG